MGTFFKQISLSTLVAAFLIACGDDSVSNQKEDAQDELESSSSENVVESSSSVSKKTSSSSSAEELDSSSSLKEVDPDVIDSVSGVGVSGVVGLDSYTSVQKVKMVELDSADGYDETENVFSAEIGKDGAYEFKNVNLIQPFVRVSAEVTLISPSDGKSFLFFFSSLGDFSYI